MLPRIGIGLILALTLAADTSQAQTTQAQTDCKTCYCWNYPWPACWCDPGFMFAADCISGIGWCSGGTCDTASSDLLRVLNGLVARPDSRGRLENVVVRNAKHLAWSRDRSEIRVYDCAHKLVATVTVARQRPRVTPQNRTTS